MNLGPRLPGCRRLKPRNGGQATLAGNVDFCPPSWFADFASGDLHLTSAAAAAVDAGAPLAPGLADFDHDGDARDAQPDVGADEIGPIFSDGFESGNVSAWSVAQ